MANPNRYSLLILALATLIPWAVTTGILSYLNRSGEFPAENYRNLVMNTAFLAVILNAVMIGMLHLIGQTLTVKRYAYHGSLKVLLADYGISLAVLAAAYLIAASTGKPGAMIQSLGMLATGSFQALMHSIAVFNLARRVREYGN